MATSQARINFDGKNMSAHLQANHGFGCVNGRQQSIKITLGEQKLFPVIGNRGELWNSERSVNQNASVDNLTPVKWLTRTKAKQYFPVTYCHSPAQIIGGDRNRKAIKHEIGKGMRTWEHVCD